jgi:hypothetical protein
MQVQDTLCCQPKVGIFRNVVLVCRPFLGRTCQVSRHVLQIQSFVIATEKCHTTTTEQQQQHCEILLSFRKMNLPRWRSSHPVVGTTVTVTVVGEMSVTTHLIEFFQMVIMS